MKRVVKFILSIIGVIIGLSYVIVIIVSLIYDTKETLQWLIGMVAIGIVIFYLVKLNDKLKSKNKIDWGKYDDLDAIRVCLYVASLFSLIEAIVCPLFELHYVPINTIILFLIIFSYSFWAYISLTLAKRNALFILRAYLISITSLLVLRLTIICTESPNVNLDSLFYITNWSSQNIFFNKLSPILATLFICSIIALCIKGLIQSFKPHIVELFKDSSISYLQILVIILMWVGIVAMFNTQITFTETTQSNYPALNSSK